MLEEMCRSGNVLIEMGEMYVPTRPLSPSNLFLVKSKL